MSARRYFGVVSPDSDPPRDPESAPPTGAGSWPAPATFVWGDPLPPPSGWDRPGLVMFFNLECAGCVARGVPFLKRLERDHRGRIHALLIHTPFGHRDLPRDAVEPQLRRFASSFARLEFPVALDEDGTLARAWAIEGTPHWLAFAPGGELLRSIYGSQDNAQTRLRYLLEERLGDDR